MIGIQHCLTLAFTSVPITLAYQSVFQSNNWLDIGIIVFVTLVLSFLLGSTLYVSCLIRFYCGRQLTDVRCRIPKPIVQYDVENDPACLSVRECLCMIDAIVNVYPMPYVDQSKSISKSCVLYRRFIEDYQTRTSRADVVQPTLEDPNTGLLLCGDADSIVTYLQSQYCRQGSYLDKLPPLNNAKLETVTAKGVQMQRSFQAFGYYAQPSQYNRRPLRFFGMENHPECKQVREMLCSYQQHYDYITCSEGGSGRASQIMEIGDADIPVLHDSSTNSLLQGYVAISQYIREVYGIGHTDSQRILSLGTTSRGKGRTKLELVRQQELAGEEWAKKWRSKLLSMGTYVEEDEDEEGEDEEEKSIGGQAPEVTGVRKLAKS